MNDILKTVMYTALFAVPFVLLIVSSSMFFPYITGKNFAFRILVEISFMSWLLLTLYDKTYRPRWSWLVGATALLVAVMFVADLSGEYPLKSFWSNYERMEGWVTLIHFFLYFITLAHALKSEALWQRYFKVALIPAAIMSLYALAQVFGAIDVSQGSAWRVDGRMGNSSYLGVYMLFQMFIAAWLFSRTPQMIWRLTYGGLFLLFAFILFNTGTRGTVLGLFGGGLLAFLYLAYSAPHGATIRKWALGGLCTLLLIAGGLWFARDTDFVSKNPALSRFSNISLSEGGVRFTIWKMALEGVKERPILGWGQENFSYVFNKYYDPSLYAAEPWYDRTHNIFLDWLIAGGFLGLLSYLAILIVALYYAVLRPAVRRLKLSDADESNFTVTDQALVLGLLAAYMFHNLFVFDNLGSWIFYAVILAFIHSRVAQPIVTLESFRFNKDTLDRVVVPLVVAATGVLVYFVNAPGILAAKDIISGYQATTVDGKIESFRTALERDSFATQEITEQFAQLAGPMVTSADISESKRLEIKAEVVEAFRRLKEEKPGDARVHLVLATFYRMSGDYDNALTELKVAQALSPRKASLIEEEGIIQMMTGDQAAAVKSFRRAYEFNTGNYDARVNLAAALINAGSRAEAMELLDRTELAKKEGLWYELAENNLMLSVAHQHKLSDLLLEIMNTRVEIDPGNIDHRKNLAAVYYEMGDVNRAIGALEAAVREIPSFRSQGNALIEQLKKEQ